MIVFTWLMRLLCWVSDDIEFFVDDDSEINHGTNHHLINLDYIFLLTLGAEYKRKFKSDDEKSESKTNILSKVCTFVDMVPPFRELANKSMGSMLEAQKSQLFDLISPRLTSFKEALSSNESVSEWDDAETALRAALYHLRHLAQSWSQVLSREVYHLAIGERAVDP